jgi:ribose transport system substrate-binding protein
MKFFHIGLGTIVVASAMAVLLAAWDVVQVESESPRIVMILGGRGPFWQRAARGAEAAARQQGARLTIEMPAHGGLAAEQARLLAEAAADDPDAIAICPVNPQSQRSALAAAARQCNIVTFLNEVPESPAIGHVGVNPYVVGKRAAHLAAAWAPTGAKLALIRSRPDDEEESDRVCGFRDALRYWRPSEPSSAEQPPLEIVELTPQPRGRRHVAEALRLALESHADVACHVFVGDGRVAAACASGAVGRIATGRIIVFGESPEILDALGRGHVDAAIGVDPYDVGHLVASMATCWRHRTGLALPAPGLGRVSLPIRVMRADDIEDFYPELKRAPSFATINSGEDPIQRSKSSGKNSLASRGG